MTETLRESETLGKAITFREFGVPNRIGIVKSMEDLQNFLKIFNTKKNCHISVYEFNKIDNEKIDYNSAMIDKIFLDFDSTNLNEVWEDYGRLQEFVSNFKLAHRTYFSGSKGLHVFLDFPVVAFKNPKLTLRTFCDSIKIKYNLNSLDRQTFGDVARLCRVPNTMHMESKLYCIPLFESEVLTQEPPDILKLSKSPRYDFITEFFQSENLLKYLTQIDKHLDERTYQESLNEPIVKVGECDGFQNAMRGAGEGNRDWTLTGLIHYLKRKSHSKSEIISELKAWNRRCCPPLPEPTIFYKVSYHLNRHTNYSPCYFLMKAEWCQNCSYYRKFVKFHEKIGDMIK